MGVLLDGARVGEPVIGVDGQPVFLFQSTLPLRGAT